jgi:short-subunit dehydrogenase
MPSQSLLLLTCFAVLVACCWIPLQTHQNRYTKEDIQERYGEWAIVAGASEGLGASWADLLCENGLNVLLLARRQLALDQLASQLHAKHSHCQVDTWVQDLKEENLQEHFSKVLFSDDINPRKYGLLVYNAAYGAVGNFLDKTLEDNYKVINIDVRGVVTMTHMFGNYLKQRARPDSISGGIVLMSSMAGLTGCSAIANYAATKSWNTVFSHGLYRELKPLGIDVLACVAGATLTPNYRKFGGDESDFGAQTPEAVSRECLQALGSVPSLATGPVNKMVRFLFARLLPASVGLEVMSAEREKRSKD